MSADLFAEIEAKERARVAWPFPSERKREEQALIASILGQHKPEIPHTSPAPARAVAPAGNVSILALDLGTKCGFALAGRDGAIEYGTEVFDPKHGHGERWAAYRAWLSALIAKHGITVLYFEDVKRHVGTLAAHAYGGFLAMTQMVCHQHRVRMVGVGVGQVKKGFTGSGSATKGLMIAAAQEKGFHVGTGEDNTADAIGILHYAVKEEA